MERIANHPTMQSMHDPAPDTKCPPNSKPGLLPRKISTCHKPWPSLDLHLMQDLFSQIFLNVRLLLFTYVSKCRYLFLSGRSGSGDTSPFFMTGTDIMNAYENEVLYISVWFAGEQDAADFADYPVASLDGDRVVIAPTVPPGESRSIYDHLRGYPGVIDFECH